VLGSLARGPASQRTDLGGDARLDPRQASIGAGRRDDLGVAIVRENRCALTATAGLRALLRFLLLLGPGFGVVAQPARKTPGRSGQARGDVIGHPRGLDR